MSNGKTAVKTDAAPGALGPYSQAIVAGGMVYCAGQIPLDPVAGNSTMNCWMRSGVRNARRTRPSAAVSPNWAGVGRSRRKHDLSGLVELRGIEPLTSSLRTRRSPS